MPDYVFVYGTLRRGEINDIALAAARQGLPVPRLAGLAGVPGVLYDFGDWPGLADDAQAPPVAGEVYEIDPRLLPVLDEIEEYAPGRDCLFVRRRVTLALDAPAGSAETPAGRAGKEAAGDGAGRVDCWYYPIDLRLAGRAQRTQARDWVAYRLERGPAPA